MSVAIRFEHVSRKFVLRYKRSRSFQDLVINFLHRRNGGAQEEYWALQDVSFEIAAGEMVGLIGPNGAGKSTALKLISRIIDPTAGRILIDGRVGALLELGTGFHPDLTGRENIYLNGAILGMGRPQIRARLDEIISFAELDRFIDVPVKHYSSGMYVRLGFSVAVHTDPHILLVDEVLAVGDASFQRKCLERIDNLRQEGISVLFVSHDLGAVRRLCRRAIWLDKGKVLADDNPETVIRQYLWRSHEEYAAGVCDEESRRHGSGEVRFEEVHFLDSQGRQRDFFATGEPLIVEMHYRAGCRVERPVFGLAIHRSDGAHITGPNTQFARYEIPSIEGEGMVRYTVPFLPLLEGTYYLTVAVHDWEDTHMFDYHDRLYSFRVLPTPGERYGLVTLQGEWHWDG
jgi:ABC-type polysaccharide/polyol phosphate transport system ATPase subunit